MSLSVMLAALVVGAPQEDPRPKNRYAIVIGYNDSEDKNRTKLRYADDDAARFFEAIVSSTKRAYLLVTFDETSQQIFPNLVPIARPPKKAELNAAALDLFAALEEDRLAEIESELYFFYAGHGDVADGDGFVNLADGRLTGTAFRQMLKTQLDATTTHVVIDACKSYFFVAGRGPGGIRVPELTSFSGPDELPGVGYVLSTSDDADTHEWAAVSGGIFSHEVRSAMLGGADVDGDDVVDYEELAAFVAVANEMVPFPRYRPQIFVRPPPGDRRTAFFDTNSIRSARWLELAPGHGGRVSITDHRGLRYADVHKVPTERLRVALLQPKRYDIDWNRASYHVDTGTGTVQLTTLEPDPTYLASRSEVHEAFEFLFEAPFGSDVVRGYRLAPRLAPPTSAVVQTDLEPQSDVVTPALIGSGAALVLTGAILAILATDARLGIDPMTSGLDRERALDRSDRLAIGAGVTGGIGIAALGVAMYTTLTQ